MSLTLDEVLCSFLDADHRRPWLAKRAHPMGDDPFLALTKDTPHEDDRPAHVVDDARERSLSEVRRKAFSLRR